MLFRLAFLLAPDEFCLRILPLCVECFFGSKGVCLQPLLALQCDGRLGVDVQVIPTPPCIFCMENHE